MGRPAAERQRVPVFSRELRLRLGRTGRQLLRRNEWVISSAGISTVARPRSVKQLNVRTFETDGPAVFLHVVQLLQHLGLNTVGVLGNASPASAHEPQTESCVITNGLSRLSRSGARLSLAATVTPGGNIRSALHTLATEGSGWKFWKWSVTNDDKGKWTEITGEEMAMATAANGHGLPWV